MGLRVPLDISDNYLIPHYTYVSLRALRALRAFYVIVKLAADRPAVKIHRVANLVPPHTVDHSVPDDGLLLLLCVINIRLYPLPVALHLCDTLFDFFF